MCMVRGIGVAAVSEHPHFFAAVDFFFMRHAEPLLLIDNQKAKIFELYVLRQNAVCSDDNIHESFFQILQRFFLLCRRAEPAQKITRTGKSFMRSTNVL